jgi:4-amino-4-deoxy-L-arabinose transferase-like glycosyltransferase
LGLSNPICPLLPGDDPTVPANRLTRLFVTHIPLILVVLLAAVLRLWHLGANGFGTEYYAAGVRSMLQGPRAFFFNAFDPAGFLSLDKPPVAFWIQAASATILGFSGLSLILPQMLEGIASIMPLWDIARRRSDAATALLAALFLAITPASVAVDRSNNTDACLVLTLLVAAWAGLRAIETARLAWLAAAAALFGLAFNVKMLAALVAVPGFAALYLLTVRLPWPRRLIHLACAGAVLCGVSLAWSAVYDLTPASRRPFVDSTKGNSMLELAVWHNGVDRFSRPIADSAGANDAAPERLYRLYDAVPVGPLRLTDRYLAEQALWLLPMALFGALIGLWPLRRWQAPTRQQTLTALWAVWAISYAIVYSVTGGIFHAYYLVTLAPPVAALAASGCVRSWRARTRWQWLFPAGIAITVLWQLYLVDPDRGSPLRLIIAGILLTGCALAAGTWIASGRLHPAMARGVAALAVATLCIGPLAAALGNVLVPGNPTLPASGLERLAGDGDPGRQRRLATRTPATADPKLLEFLLANHGSEQFLVATMNARLAAPVIVRTGMAAMAIGGYLGSDPIVTTRVLDACVNAGELRFLLLDGRRSLDRNQEAEANRRRLTAWARRRGVPVDPALWRSDRQDNTALELIDLRGGDIRMK